MSRRSARPVLLATLALGLVGFLCWGPSFGGPSQYYRDLYDGWRSPDHRPPTLTERVRVEEARYAETLKGRQWLIEKHGPRKEQVQSWVIHFFFLSPFPNPLFLRNQIKK